MFLDGFNIVGLEDCVMWKVGNRKGRWWGGRWQFDPPHSKDLNAAERCAEIRTSDILTLGPDQYGVVAICCPFSPCLIVSRLGVVVMIRRDGTAFVPVIILGVLFVTGGFHIARAQDQPNVQENERNSSAQQERAGPPQDPRLLPPILRPKELSSEEHEKAERLKRLAAM